MAILGVLRSPVNFECRDWPRSHAKLASRALLLERLEVAYCSATTSISIRASLGRAAAWTVERDGGSFLKNCP